MIYRKAEDRDVDAIIGLIRARIRWMDEVGISQWNKTDYFGRYPREYFIRNLPYFLIAEENGKVVAAAALYTEDIRWPNNDRPAFYVHHLVADPDVKGAGGMLCDYCAVWAKENGAEVLRLDSAVGNTALEGFYASRGYEPRGECQDRLYFGILREKKL